MLSGTDIFAQIYTPECLARKCHAVDKYIVCVAALGVIERLGFPFEEDLVLSVTVHVAHDAIIRRVAVARWVQRQIKIILPRCKFAVVGRNDLPAGNGIYTVLRIRSAGAVIEARRFSSVAGVNELVPTVQPKLCIIRVIGIEAPAHEHSIPRLYGVNTTVEILDNAAARAADAVIGACRESRCH